MNIYTKQRSNVIVYDLSDHMPSIMVVKNYLTDARSKQYTCKHSLTEKNISKLYDHLCVIEWDNHLMHRDAESSMNRIHTLVMENLDVVAPERLVPVSTNRAIKESWMAPGLLKCSKKQRLLYERYLADRTLYHCIKCTKQFTNEQQDIV